MLKFEFDSSDLDAFSKQYHSSFKVEFEDGSEDTIGDILEKFKAFCYAKGYCSDLVDKIVIDDDYLYIEKPHWLRERDGDFDESEDDEEECTCEQCQARRSNEDHMIYTEKVRENPDDYVYNDKELNPDGTCNCPGCVAMREDQEKGLL